MKAYNNDPEQCSNQWTQRGPEGRHPLTEPPTSCCSVWPLLLLLLMTIWKYIGSCKKNLICHLQNCFKYVTRKVQVNQNAIELKRHIRLWFMLMSTYWARNLQTTKKSTEALLRSSKKAGTEVNSYKIKSVFKYRHKKAERYTYT